MRMSKIMAEQSCPLFPSGSKEEEEEFANLSPAEAKKRLALMFEKMDSNQDTFVSKDEIVAWILRSYM